MKRKSAKVKIRPGDIYAVMLNNTEYIAVRVMLSVSDQCYDSGILTEDSSLELFESTCLVEIFKNTISRLEINEVNINEKLFKGIFLGFAGFIISGEWKYIGNIPITPEEVYFPGFVLGLGAYHGIYNRGEVEIEFEMNLTEVEKIGLPPRTFPGVGIDALYLKNVGRENEIPSKYLNIERFNKENFDLEESKHKEQIQAIIGEDVNLPYMELSKKYGFDFNRFY